MCKGLLTDKRTYAYTNDTVGNEHINLTSLVRRLLKFCCYKIREKTTEWGSITFVDLQVSTFLRRLSHCPVTL